VQAYWWNAEETATPGWWRGTAVEHHSLDGKLSLSCVRHVADG